MFPGVSRFPWLEVAAVCVALGLHAGVLAMVLSSPVTAVAPGRPDALDVQFVELAPAAPPGLEAAVAEAPAEPESVPELESAPEFEPVPETESAPEPPPDPVPEPTPEAVEQPPAPTPEPPKPRPKSKPVKTRAEPVKHREKAVARPPLRRAAEASAATAGARSAGGAPERLAAAAPVSAADVDRPRIVGQVDYLGKRPTPVYPRLSERRGEQGRVVLRVLISPQGRVSDVTVRRSSGYRRLDEAAVDAMRQARFKPYTENGVAYKALVDIPFDFVL